MILFHKSQFLVCYSLGQPRGFLFADFLESHEAQKAVSVLNGFELKGKRLNCSLKRKDGARDNIGNNLVERKTFQNRVEESSEKTLYLSNINFAITKENIEEMCSDLVGPDLVEFVRFPIDRERGTSRGFCYVTFKDAASANSALDILNGVPVLGRELRVHRYEVRTPTNNREYN